MDPEARRAWEAARPGRDHAVDAVCIAPWVSLELDPTGWVYGCCANQLHPLGRIGVDRLGDIWNGARAGVLRTALQRWDLSVGCGACRWHLEHGRLDPDADVYDRYPLDVTDPSGPVAMTFALSNRCNLGCVMCTPELSSVLRTRAGLPAIASPYDDAFFADLAGFLPRLRYAKFLGGEPFLIPEHHRVWDLMAEVGGPDRIQVTTNGTIWNDRVEQVLDDFAVDVTVSIDAATPEVYESIRVGAQFATVSEHIVRFRDRCRDAGTEFRLCYCLMRHNAAELPAFLRWAETLGAAVSINVVSDLGHALHDEPVDALDAVRRAWAGAHGTGELTGERAAVWSTQQTQLDTVIAERRAGAPIAPRQAQRASSAVLDIGALPPVAVTAARIEAEVAFLAAWSGSPDVGRLVGDSTGTVIEVAHPHARLGIDAALVGASLSDLVPTLERADGRVAWVIEVSADDDRAVRGFVLSATQPERGGAGSVVRVVLFRTAPDRWTALVAEDRVYDVGADGSGDAVTVSISPR
jgi:MoaA/NifB/PqqE/SkfB family radical SAM enzyme